MTVLYVAAHSHKLFAESAYYYLRGGRTTRKSDTLPPSPLHLINTSVNEVPK